AADLDGGLLFVLAASAVGVLGTLMAGWSSANKYALLGAMRSAAQLLAYEVPLVLAASSVAMAAGTLSLIGMAHAGRGEGLGWPGPGRSGFRDGGVGGAEGPAVRHAAGGLGARGRAVHRIHRPAVRVVPARRVRRHRAALRARRCAVPGRLAGSGSGGARAG